ncbi:hypothetical protein SNOG_03412 [Parastagonospora nodorum SN15]|uniref:Uncharacterized protein n=1 Tax=Phaeosphaeria nodorum (strain SN15 / ATCC MYA-4574 / FGSC 10173) TaxID=321614 RepID=Q0UXV2_PHANO|nr:hypothetical protein SNOG_03412 [Parastagonospora nodorum SN15]KAH4004556.1 hypothetical protein HBI10_045780 [Parastagonospora nodorum]EAT88617.2 hypothetical protein SNOG_03412 [Parastagonospora nodorum SN15]KAH4031138.1 hypothetical protein HBI13_029230 [Parastagonospora nodorum]KAH4424492.1 hypothetical protein HBH93_188430 [Parastagonospora nodorum]KAH4561030.1 hypothetical protein HBH86_071320 [Parastagonospora nodorum]
MARGGWDRNVTCGGRGCGWGQKRNTWLSSVEDVDRTGVGSIEWIPTNKLHDLFFLYYMFLPAPKPIAPDVSFQESTSTYAPHLDSAHSSTHYNSYSYGTPHSRCNHYTNGNPHNHRNWYSCDIVRSPYSWYMSGTRHKTCKMCKSGTRCSLCSYCRSGLWLQR